MLRQRDEDGERASNERRRDGRELNHTIDETIDQYRSSRAFEITIIHQTSSSENSSRYAQPPNPKL